MRSTRRHAVVTAAQSPPRASRLELGSLELRRGGRRFSATRLMIGITPIEIAAPSSTFMLRVVSKGLALRRVATLGLAVVSAGGCSEMTLGGGSSTPSSSTTYPSSILSQYSPAAPSAQNCWLSSDLDCAREQANQAATEAKLEQLRREQARSREVMLEQSEQQQRATMLAAGRDPDTGKGFWCFTGTQGEHALGECRRTEDACIDRLLWREGKGMKMTDRRCARHAQAACFRVTRSLREGERFMCFDRMTSCAMLHDRVAPEGLASPPGACEVTR